MMRKQGGFFPNPPEGLLDPMEYTHGYRFFDFFTQNEEHRQAFNDYMAARREGYQLQWYDIFPARERLAVSPVKTLDEVIVCDVGGGQGHELVKFKERYPDLRGRLVLEDLETSFEGVKLPEGIEMLAHDFFKPQPIQGTYRRTCRSYPRVSD